MCGSDMSSSVYLPGSCKFLPVLIGHVKRWRKTRHTAVTNTLFVESTAKITNTPGP